MYISQIQTKLVNILDVYKLHQMVWKGFVDNGADYDRDFLFRAEQQLRKRAAVLVQSLSEPRWEGKLPEETVVSVKSYEPVLQNGRMFHFMILASASFTKPNGPDKKSTRMPLAWSEYEKWFARQGEAKGFEPLAVAKVHDVFARSRAKENLRLSGRLLSGVLRVTDSNAFMHAYQNGVGRGRAFGFGMFSLKRV